jgi:hypothetical protein
MRIDHADLLCIGGRVLEPFDSHRDFYHAFPADAAGAETELRFCTSPEGTAMNAQSQGAGSATYGSCARRFVVKGNAP